MLNTAEATLPPAGVLAQAARVAGNSPHSKQSPSASNGKIALCSKVEDFYTAAARKLIGSICRPFLNQTTITATELLHSAQYQQRLDSAGMFLRTATEKAAMLQAQQLSEPRPKRVRELQDLITSVAMATREAEQSLVPTLSPGSFAAAARAARNGYAEPIASRRVNRMLTEYLAPAKTWAAKLELGLALAEEAAITAEMPLADSLLSEILSCDIAQDALLGRSMGIDRRIHDLVALHNGAYPPSAKSATTPLALRLNNLLRQGKWIETRGALENAILGAIASPDTLQSPEMLMELKATHSLLARLKTEHGLIGGKRALGYIDRRMARLLQTDTITDYVRGSMTVGERVLALLEIHTVTFGPTNRKLVEDFLHRYLSSADFGRRMMAMEGSAAHKIKIMAELYRAISQSSLHRDDKSRYTNYLVKLQLFFLKQSKFFANFDRQQPNQARKAMQILNFCLDGYFIAGDNLDRAKAVIKHYLSHPDFMKHLGEILPGQAHNKPIEEVAKKFSALGLTLPHDTVAA